MAGTVVNNAILVIDYALKKQEEGLGAEAAVIEAVKSRYRPIMMTAFSDVVGMMPLALQLALGSERFSPLAITVIWRHFVSYISNDDCHSGTICHISA